jgi:4-hydroxybenzoate polyprenyltransferase
MFGPLSHRLLTILQLTRMALVFTAISNAAAEVLLRAAVQQGAGPDDLLEALSPWSLAAMTAVSVGLYGFGMTLNDIIDRRRDSRVAAHRPLPSGRIRLGTAHVICAGLALLAVWGGWAYARWSVPHTGKYSLVFLGVTVGLIAFYDYAGKYLVGLGLLSLGMIRFMQAAIAAPDMPVIWHPLLLLNHVTLLSAVCYLWEEKRPPLTPKHWAAAIGGLLVVDLGLIRIVGFRRGDDTLRGVPAALHLNDALLPALAAAVAFVFVALVVRRRNANGREAGQKLMLYGLLWLIVYDAAFVGGYASWPAAAGLVCLLPVAFGCVQLMRWWSRVVSLSQRPVYQRART